LKKLISFILICAALVAANACTREPEAQFVRSGLAAVEVTGDYISPSDGVDIATASELIAQYRAEQGIGEENKQIRITEEMTIEQIRNEGIQLFSFGGKDSWGGDAVAVIYEGEVISILSGLPIHAIYLADINSDGMYDICTQASHGSGFVHESISVLDIQSGKEYSMVQRVSLGLELKVDKTTEQLVVYDSTAEEWSLLGELRIIDDDLLIFTKDGNRSYKKVISIDPSVRFEYTKINAATGCVRRKFKDFTGCELIRIWYDEEHSDAFIEGYLSDGGGAVNSVDSENMIVLLSDFYVNPTGADVSLNPDSVYRSWNWILVRDHVQSEWRVVDWGY